MSGALGYEITRLRTLRSTWWLLAIPLIGTAAVSFGIAWGARTDTSGMLGPAEILSFAAGLGTIFVALVGVLSFGHEYRYGTIRPALTAVPSRSALMTAKLAVMAVWALVYGVLSLLVAYVVVLVVPGQDLASAPLPWEPVGRVTLGYFVLLVLYAVVGLCFAGLMRNLPAALVTLFVFPLVVETLLRAILLIPGLSGIAWIGKYLPFGAGDALIQTEIADVGDAPEAFQTLAPLAGGLTFAAFTAALLALTWMLFHRRDA
jgi:ABC-2 type transport system permease protein